MTQKTDISHWFVFNFKPVKTLSIGNNIYNVLYEQYFKAKLKISREKKNKIKNQLTSCNENIFSTPGPVNITADCS